MKFRLSLLWRIVLPLIVVLTLGMVLIAWLADIFGSGSVGVTLVGLVTAIAAFVVVKKGLRPLADSLEALLAGIDRFEDQDYSVSISGSEDPDVGGVVLAFNELSETLRQERYTLFQRELMLDTVIESSAVAVLITNQAGIESSIRTGSRGACSEQRSFHQWQQAGLI